MEKIKMEKNLHEIVPIAVNMAIGKCSNNNIAVPYLQSPPGAGKSAMIKQEVIKRGWGYLSVHWAFIALEELGGLPREKEIQINERKFSGTQWSFPEIMTQIYELSSSYQNVIVLLDDFHLCSPSHSTLGYELFTERKLRGFKLPDNVGIILAGNDTAKAGMKTLSSGIVNRCAIMPIRQSFEHWRNNFAIKNNLYFPGIQFLTYETNRKFFHGEEQVNESWPSPRQWTNLFVLLQAMKEANILNENDIRYFAVGHVGDEAGNEFATWHELFSKVDVKSAFEGNFTVPSKLSELFAFGTAITIELFDRIKKNKKSDIVYQKFAAILSKMAANNAELTIGTLKSVVDLQKQTKMKGVYQNIMKHLPSADRDKFSQAIMEI